MKTKIVLIAMLLLIPASGWAVPFITCDPQTLPVKAYRLDGPGWVPRLVLAEPNGTVKLDIAHANVGENVITMKACLDIEGLQCGAPAWIYLNVSMSGSNYKSHDGAYTVRREWWIGKVTY